MMNETKTPMVLAAILYEGFELLDLFGPLEMFGNLKPHVQTLLVAERAGPVGSFQGPSALADYGFKDCPGLDLILLPGGFGTLRELNNPAMLDFLRTRVPKANLTMTVCSGSWILAKAGLLDGRRATSNKMFFDIARQQSNQVEWVARARWVEDGPFVTSSGVSAGMDMALAVIARLFGDTLARQVAVAAEYRWLEDAGEDPFHPYLNQYDESFLEEMKATVGA